MTEAVIQEAKKLLNLSKEYSHAQKVGNLYTNGKEELYDTMVAAVSELDDRDSIISKLLQMVEGQGWQPIDYNTMQEGQRCVFKTNQDRSYLGTWFCNSGVLLDYDLELQDDEGVTRWMPLPNTKET